VRCTYGLSVSSSLAVATRSRARPACRRSPSPFAHFFRLCASAQVTLPSRPPQSQTTMRCHPIVSCHHPQPGHREDAASGLGFAFALPQTPICDLSYRSSFHFSIGLSFAGIPCVRGPVSGMHKTHCAALRSRFRPRDIGCPPRMRPAPP
jgi:hypothetical protein